MLHGLGLYLAYDTKLMRNYICNICTPEKLMSKREMNNLEIPKGVPKGD